MVGSASDSVSTGLTFCLATVAAVLFAGLGAQDHPIQAEDAGPAARGERFARANCSGCHNVGLDDGEPYDAPTFRKLAQRLHGQDLTDRFTTISEHGSGEMPPIAIPSHNVDDLIAYFDRLRTWPR